MSFYRKYRPQVLTELVGQDHIRQTFLGALKKGLLAHAYLFTGPRGTGKTSTARIIARAINCENPAADGEPCNACPVCVDALNSHLVDLIEIDAASNRGIDEIRELKEKISFAPSRARAKIYIIDEVHMLTKEAFNALLKTLEEPPAHAYFILATTESHKVPETIISRCQRFDFHRIETKAMAAHLAEIAQKEGIKADEKALTLIAKQSAGGLRDALGLLDQLGAGGEITLESIAENLGLTRPQTVEDFTHALLFGQLNAALAAIEGLVADGVNLVQFNKAVLGRLRELMLERVAENKIGAAKTILAIIEQFTRAGEELKSAIIPQLPLELAVILVIGADEKSVELPKQPDIAPTALAQKKSPEPVSLAPKVQTAAVPELAKAEPTKILEPAQVAPAEPEKLILQAEISLEAAAVALRAVVPKLKLPAAKMALRAAQVTKIEASQITIGVGSELYRDKASQPEAKAELAELLGSELGVPVQLAFEVAEIEIKSAAPEAPKTSEPVKSAPAKKDLATAAEDLFADGEDW